MGIVQFSIPKELVLRLISEKPFNNFVETGTYKGGTTFWAAQYFPKVYTIEIDSELSAQAASHPMNAGNIEFLVGDSRVVLPKLISTKIQGSSLFWLDGHWCSGGGGKDAECPLLEELTAISSLKDVVVLIDDARCFLGPLPKPHNSSDWPRIDQIFQLAKKLFPTHRVTIQDDVILILPPFYFKVFEDFWEESYSSRYEFVSKKSLWKKIKNKLSWSN